VRTGEDLRVSRGVNQIDAINAEKILITLPQASIPGDELLVNACDADVDVEGGALDIMAQDPVTGVLTVPGGGSAVFTLTSCCDPKDPNKKREWAVLLGQNLRCPECVPDLATLAALPTLTLDECCHVLVLKLDQKFEFSRTSTATPDGITIVAGNGGGNWLRISSVSPRWSLQANWFVDPVTGNDENDGNTAATALKTLAEWSRRVVRLHASTTPFYTITLLNDIPDTDIFRPTGEVDATDSNNNVILIVMKGQRSAAFTGTTGAGSLVTVPSTNTQATFDGGVGFVPAAHIGKMIEILDGPPGAVTNRLAWVLKQDAAGPTIARVSEYITVNPTTLPATTVALAAAPAAGVPYRVVNTTSFGPEFLGMGSPLFKYHFIDITLPTSAFPESFTITMIRANLSTCSISRNTTSLLGGSGTFYGCGFSFVTSTEVGWLPGCAVATIGCAFVNAILIVVVTGNATFSDTVVQSGAIRTVAEIPQPAFGGTFTGVLFPGGILRTAGTRGVGVFDSPANRSGIEIRRGGKMFVLGNLYGKDNGEYGVDVREASSVQIRNVSGVSPAIVPTITGALGDVQLDGATSWYQQLEAHSGALAAAVVVPLTTWAQWNAPVALNVSGFARNVVSHKTSANIIDTLAPAA
jgi:hypothetical protein